VQGGNESGIAKSDYAMRAPSKNRMYLL
jgi:hypothetical protein